MNNTKIDIVNLIDDYIKKRDWRVQENANVKYSFPGLFLYLAGTAQAKYCLEKLPSEIREAHESGFIHIHDLSFGLTNYCSGWSLMDLLNEGLNRPDCSSSKPPKHFSTALHQMVNFLGILQNETAGAVSFNNIDTLLAPYIYYDKLTYEEVKQEIQSFVFGLNTTSRFGGQSPFSNVSLDVICPDFLKKQPVMIGGEVKNKTYSELQNEITMFNKAFIEILERGDGGGRMFSFPIPTYSITEDFPWESEVGEKLLGITAKYGSPYFTNFINGDLKPEDVRSMCCRLRIDKREVIKKVGGLFGQGDLTGSIGVLTLNLPRLAYLAKCESDFFDLINAYSIIAKNYLEIKRNIISDNLVNGLLPWSKRYLKNSFKGHFSTIGVVGGHEACLNLLGENYGIDSPEGKSLMKKVLLFLIKKIEGFQAKTGNLFSLEATPAESCARRFAKLDQKDFPDIIQSGESIKYYTNSTNLPVVKKIDVIDAILHQSDLQPIYSGGCVFHSYLGENIGDINIVKNYIKKVFTKTKIPYLTITPTFSICCDHGYISGEHKKCPTCGRVTEVYSRVVGYYRAVSSWNDSKQAEYKDRQMFTLDDCSEDVNNG